MRAYYMDSNNKNAGLTSPNDSGISVDVNHLQNLGIQYYLNPDVEKIAIEQGYRNRDEVKISKDAMGVEEYTKKLDIFKIEHLHTDIEARLILDGSGYFDVRDRLNNNEQWIRIKVEEGDLIILPPGIFHRFTPDDNGYTHAMRLFTDEPKWQPYNRSNEVEKDPSHIDYLKSIGVIA